MISGYIVLDDNKTNQPWSQGDAGQGQATHLHCPPQIVEGGGDPPPILF